MEAFIIHLNLYEFVRQTFHFFLQHCWHWINLFAGLSCKTTPEHQLSNSLILATVTPLFYFNINRFRMTCFNRKTYTCCCNLKFRHMHNFFRFIDHFHFFKCKAIILEFINLWNGIKSNLIMFFVSTNW